MATSFHLQCVEAMAADIVALGVAGLGEDQVYTRKLPYGRNATLPCVLVSLPLNLGERMVGGDNAREDVQYPVQISFLVVENQDLEADDDFDAVLVWREQLLLHYHNARLSGFASVDRVISEPGQIIDLEHFKAGKLAGNIIAWCQGRRTRT